MKPIAILLPILFLLFASIDAEACLCSGPRMVKNFQPCGIFWRADVVFTGLAEKVSHEKSSNGEDSRTVVEFIVEKAIRGVEGKTIEVETNASLCGYPFKQGERYFVYLRRGEDGRLKESSCGPTVLLKYAEQDLEYLRAVENGETGGRVSGNVSRLVQTSAKEQRTFEPLAGIEIIVNSLQVIDQTRKDAPKYVSRRFTVKTDQSGNYLFMGIPEGSYSMEAAFPKELREIYPREDLTRHYISIDNEKQRCDAENFLATSLGSIEGRVRNKKGSKLLQQYISLVPINESGNARLDSAYQNVWINQKDGKYRFDIVAPGSYLLGVNPKNCPSKETSAYGKSFFPGVLEELQAKPVMIRDSEHVKLDDFKLTPTRDQRLFSGRVITVDKKPVSGAKVLLNVGNNSRCMLSDSLATAITDELGRFELKGYEGYEYKIYAYIETKSSKTGRLLSKPLEILPSGIDLMNWELIVQEPY